MMLTNGSSPVLNPESCQSQGRVLKGQYTGALRSDKGKLKGLLLNTGGQEQAVKLPKYLRPMLVREIMPNAYIQVWAYPDGDSWRGINILPLSDDEQLSIRSALPPAPQITAPKDQTVCIQVCGKGKCCKQGSRQLGQLLQAEVAANPALEHVSIEFTGCMKACKQGPNMRILPTGRLLNYANSTTALQALSQYSSQLE